MRASATRGRGRRCLRPLLGLTAALAIPLAGSAQDVSGRWVLTVELAAGSGDATFVFEQQGDSIWGTYRGVLGEQRVRGTVTDGSVSFGFSVDQLGRVRFEGSVEGDEMSGTCDYGQLGEGTFRGNRRGGEEGSAQRPGRRVQIRTAPPPASVP